MKRYALIGALLISAVGAGFWIASSVQSATRPKPAGVLKTGQTSHIFQRKLQKDLKGQYLLFLPESYGKNKDEARPLLVFLHGSGERGANLSLVAKHGPPKRVKTDPTFPFVLLSPQCPSGRWWTDLEVTEMVLSMIEEVRGKVKIDERRIYLTGLSMGGFGVWDLACQYPEMFAAIAPLCGGGNPYLAKRLKSVPVWAFHGALDKNVHPSLSQQMVGALKQAGGDARLSIYPKGQHDIWTATYAKTELYTWLLDHRRPEAKAKK